MAQMSLNEAVVATLRAEAAAKGVSVRHLAKLSGMSPNTLNNYVYRGRIFNLDIIEAVSGGLEMEPEELMRLAIERREREMNGSNGVTGE